MTVFQKIKAICIILVVGDFYGFVNLSISGVRDRNDG